MVRLSDRAYKILLAEIEQGGEDDIASKVQRDIVLKRLGKLREQSGEPVSLSELRSTLIDIYPNFSEKTLQAAAAANGNRPSGLFGKIKWAAVFLTGATGLVWVANLPYPMIRWPVANTLPIVLLPSFISMDYHYRQAISLVEQADQLVNKATGSADIDLGEVKVKEAQKHLDGLPVWFVGYYPQRYCSLFGCSWKFSLDEFEDARKKVGRMEAKVFQEKNGQTQLSEATFALEGAKQQYQNAKTAAEKEKAIATWRAAVDQLEQIPRATLAREMADPKLEAAKRDFEQVADSTTGGQRSGTLIDAAKAFAMQAALASQNPPHPAAKWEEVAELWEEAIDLLKQVRVETPGYLEAQTKLAEYKATLLAVRTRLEAEKDSAEALERAQDMTQNLIASTPKDVDQVNRNRVISEIQSIINQLKKVQYGTTAYAEAQQMLKFAQDKLKELQP